MLRDMWVAMRRLKEDRPDLIQSVEWFTFERGFRTDAEPELVALQPFDDEAKTEVATEIRNWLYYDVAGKVPRGVLVARMTVAKKQVYIVEIQRRLRKKKDKDGSLKDSEEAFKGLVFMLDDQKRFGGWLRRLLLEIRHKKGVVQNLVGNCPGKAAAFKHVSASDEKVPCQAAVLNALEKAGVKV